MWANILNQCCWFKCMLAQIEKHFNYYMEYKSRAHLIINFNHDKQRITARRSAGYFV